MRSSSHSVNLSYDDPLRTNAKLSPGPAQLQTMFFTAMLPDLEDKKISTRASSREAGLKKISNPLMFLLRIMYLETPSCVEESRHKTNNLKE